MEPWGRWGGGGGQFLCKVHEKLDIFVCVHEWSSVSLELSVVICTIEKTLHLLHVCDPVDLCV